MEPLAKERNHEALQAKYPHSEVASMEPLAKERNHAAAASASSSTSAGLNGAARQGAESPPTAFRIAGNSFAPQWSRSPRSGITPPGPMCLACGSPLAKERNHAKGFAHPLPPVAPPPGPAPQRPKTTRTPR